ncbi:hypothetical protein GCM10009716_17900 [Streptomyces sodiiphilus]|uniref:Uncharacterized protein n=1 Tax=Streptomyces sodiiphilus TaxID=226217 RepID=A0ABP5AAA4_9ACTN
MATATPSRLQTRDPKSFLSTDLWDREIELLTRDHPFDRVMAERIFGQAIAYLITAMEKWGESLEIGCGQLVDMGVHAFILDTQHYENFCRRHFSGRFLHHVPEIVRKADGTVMRTARIIEENGFKIDWPLWEKDAMACSSCAPGSNCH